jgi:UDP-N-acetylmuramoyl-tripeptide--D-alanyl-D-alanine ligase
MWTWLLLIFLLLSLLFFIHRRLLRYLQFFQQEEYNGTRFFAWLWHKKAFDTRGSMVCGASLLSTLLQKSQDHSVAYVLGGALFVIMAGLENNPRRAGKLLLNMTDRVCRIYRLGFFVLCIVLLAILLLEHWLFHYASTWGLWVSLVILLQAIPLTLVLANIALLPAERRRQAGFVADARRILHDTHPTVIGITGSYGKTSTKMILNEMLSLAAPTFTLGRSINTVMGITREIRTRMKPGHRYAVIEMGAYQRGSVTQLCALTPPHAGIITAVGVMHLERFGSPENVFLAKSELAQAVPQDGILVCNGDDPLTRRIAHENPKRQTLLYGLDSQHHLDCCMTDIQTTDAGTTFIIHWKGKQYPGTTPLCGRPMLSNLLAAFTMACALGHAPRVMLAVVASMEPIANRLEKKRLTVQLPKQASEELSGRRVRIVELRDAYNSNPVGFSAAIDELEKAEGTRKILITPGMIELGERQYAENAIVAARAAAVCQLVIIVGETNEQALRAGLRKGGLPEINIHSFSTREAAFCSLREGQQDGDVVLIENDLPDLYEITARF